MSLINKSLAVAGIGIAIPLITALFVKKEYVVEREIIINKPRLNVFKYLLYLKNQDNYSNWAKMDSEMKKSYRGIDGTVGFVSAWESNKKDVGKGEQEIIKITEGERIDYELRFFEPFKSTAPAYLITESVSDNQTKVKWGFNGHMNYPMNLLLLFINFEKMIGDDLASGLYNLKTELEKQ